VKSDLLLRPAPGLVPLSIVVVLSIAPPCARPAAAQQPDTVTSVGALKRLSLEQLMSVDVTSVSRRPERLANAASAIQVITSEDIRRSGATNLAEALRLATNLQVAQVNASQWAISARGFDNVLADKLLVMIDGRTVYTPLYAGVYWDVQNPPLESIDRIEVISGPGGALWGANAVNGVINIITKRASDTQGLYVSASGGSELDEAGTVRYGARLGDSTFARVYVDGFGDGSTRLADTTGAQAGDAWHTVQGGFRADQVRRNGSLTLQGDLYGGRPNPDGATAVATSGGDVLGRWKRSFATGGDVQLQVYFDRTYRDFRNGFTEGLSTYDADWQHHFHPTGSQDAVWGLEVRLMDHRTQNIVGSPTGSFEFLPSPRLLHLYSGFVQDEIALVRDLRFTVGTKLEHNDYTGWEVQPSARLAWSPGDRHTLWAAVSRAVRTPSRIDRDFTLSTPSFTAITGDDFQSETLVAYELGWRVQAGTRLSASVSGFYNDYDDLRSVEPDTAGVAGVFPEKFENGVRGHASGVELAADLVVSQRWRLRGGYTAFAKRLTIKPGSMDLNHGTAESDDTPNQALVQSIADLPFHVEFDAVARYVGALPMPRVPSYGELDARVGWHPTARLELSLVGQNLLHAWHAEFIPSSPSPRDIERSVYGKVALTW